MPYQDRRPVHLTNLVVPSQRSDLSADSLHTPVPCTPIPFEPVPLVMTPDTPAFNLELEDEVKPRISGTSPWTDAEDALIASYLNHPPRPLRNVYPPNSLPPPAALDELTTQLSNLSTWSSSRTWRSTRSRFLDIAQKNSASFYAGSRKRQSCENRASARELFVSPLGNGNLDVTPVPMSKGGMDITPMSRDPEEVIRQVPPIEPRAVRSKLRVLGGAKMSRQQHSMDSLYGDAEVGTMSETLRLSNTLQNRAQGDLDHSEAGARQALSSPLAFTFSFNAPRKGGPISSSLPSGVPRPLSLLNRGRSFTSHDFPSIPTTIDESSALFFSESPSPPSKRQELSSSSCTEETSPVRVQAEMLRSVSSPISSFTISPPSSVSSATSSNSLCILEDGLEEPEPFTPLDQIFPNSLGLRQPPPLRRQSPTCSSGQSTPAAAGRTTSTPAITLTKVSPDLGNSSTPTLIAPALPPPRPPTIAQAITQSPGSTARELASMSISPPQLIPNNNSSSSSITASSNETGRLGIRRPTPLSRSYSEGMHPPPTIPLRSHAHASTLISVGLGSTRLHGNLMGPIAKRQKGNNGGLSVFVPRPHGSLWSEELKSPFEHRTHLDPVGSPMSIEEELI
ncbi:hypothetical protein BD324DRAFT_652987 [Kockovaella imperatae]|uniref:Uncharacterized protein n=1 Tax=Kockovaella imperatae TaxID=4999 RepID=A0A1Y1U9L9_9TREE|nr:hypothetical protein BD324DRAFT_652987 [Kockovaella imperatae]ORX34728.1 hypothetical protein BD324DRAFT_652987 [Kockovaella imperatae]